MTLPHVIVVLIASTGGDASKGDRAIHQGVWEPTAMIRDGRDAEAEILQAIRRIVTADHVVWTMKGKNFAGTSYTTNAAKSPAEIDLIPDGGPARDKRVLGIYRFDGDTLTICVGDPDSPRPTSFSAEPGSRRTLQRFRRINQP